MCIKLKMYFKLVMFCLLLTSLFWISSVSAIEVNMMLVKIDRPYYMFGPDNAVPDSPLTFVPATGGGYYGYTANMDTYLVQSWNLWQLDSVRKDIIVTGQESVPVGGNADMGAWLYSVEKVPNKNKYHGWYHGESYTTNPGDPLSRRYARIGWCESSNGWQFNKKHYPDNTCIEWEYGLLQNGFHGSGEPSVVQWRNNYYMLFLDLPHPSENDQRWSSSVATASIGSKGKPGSWTKWYNGSFSQPGVGGKSDKPLGPWGDLGPFASVYNPSDKLVSGPYLLQFANDPNNMESWETLSRYGTEYLFNENWGDSYDGNEVIGYGSMVDTNDGDSYWDWSFYTYYLYVPPGINGNKYAYRGIAFNTVEIHDRVNWNLPAVWKTLTSYYSPTLEDSWVTTAPMIHQNLLGNNTFTGQTNAVPAFDYTNGFSGLDICYVFPSSLVPNTLPIYDGYDSSNQDHIVAWEPELTSLQNLRKIGYIYSSQEPNTVPLYRFYNSIIVDHYCDIDPTPKTGYGSGTVMGYVFPYGYTP